MSEVAYQSLQRSWALLAKASIAGAKNLLSMAIIAFQATAKQTAEEKEIADLKKKLAQLELEHEILKKSGAHLLKRRQIRYQFILDHEHCYPIDLMCRLLKVSRSGYYRFKANPQSALEKRAAETREQIKKVYFDYEGLYGSPRISAELASKGIVISRTTVAKHLNVELLPLLRQ